MTNSGAGSPQAQSKCADLTGAQKEACIKNTNAGK